MQPDAIPQPATAETKLDRVPEAWRRPLARLGLIWAALLLLTARDMTEPHKWREHLAAPLEDRALLLLTAVLTVLADLTVAIGVGVALGLALRLRQRHEPSDWTTPDR